MNLREQGKERRRQRILRSAAELIGESGVAGLTTARLAERAEVSVATLYNLIGGIDSILEGLVAELFAEFQARFRQGGRQQDPVATIERYLASTVEVLAVDAAARRAALLAVFEGMVRRGEVTPLVAGGRQVLENALRRAQRLGMLRAALVPGLLAEQMLFAQSILLESWAAGILSLRRFELQIRYHFWCLLRAWADGDFAERADEELIAFQAALMKPTKRGRADRVSPATRGTR
jgi:AcrR family transcriptional regulator